MSKNFHRTPIILQHEPIQKVSTLILESQFNYKNVSKWYKITQERVSPNLTYFRPFCLKVKKLPSNLGDLGPFWNIYVVKFEFWGQFTNFLNWFMP